MLETHPTKLCIPLPGARLRLEAPWEFRLYAESRNQMLWRSLGFPNPYLLEPFRWESPSEEVYETLALPAKTVLVVERILVRLGDDDLASVCFRVDASSPLLSARKKRFTARVEDCNQILCTLLEPLPKEEDNF